MAEHIHKPNFFIIGGPKCGTTFLSDYFEKHPHILFSKVKEPYFFNDDFKIGKLHSGATLEGYLKHNFTTTKPYEVVGEASTLYLYSKSAVRNILKFNPVAKFIVILRDPVEMCQSLHAEIYPSLENIKDFETAWSLQKTREGGKSIPKKCEYPELLQYKKICSTGSQTLRVLDTVDKKQLLIIDFNELVAKPERIHKKICNFLNTPYVQIDIQPTKKASLPRSLFLHYVIKLLSKVAKHKGKLTQLRLGGLDFLLKLNKRSQNRPQISTELKLQLEQEFSGERKKITKLVASYE